MNTYASVDHYIAESPAHVQALLRQIRETVAAAAPDADESISYGMPAFKLKGKPLAYFAAFKRHIGFYPTPRGIDEFKEALSGYKGAKGSVQFPLDAPLPLDLAARIVRFRAAEIGKKAAGGK